MNTRIYVVSQDTGAKFLVDAKSANQALRHVTGGMFQVAPATMQDVALLCGDGVKVESAVAFEAAQAAIGE